MQPITAARSFLEFRIQLEQPTPGKVRALLSSPDAEPTTADPVVAEFPLPLTREDAARAVAVAVRSAGPYVARRQQTDSFDPLKDLGERLFDALFQGRCRTLFDRGLERVKDRHRGLRLRIVTPDRAEEDLDWVPWEFLFDPRRQDFLALSARTPLVRQRGAAGRPPLPMVDTPIGATFVGSDPGGVFGVAEEVELLQRLFDDHSGLLCPRYVMDASPAGLLAELRQSGALFHFMGTGTCSSDDEFAVAPGLLLADREHWDSGALVADQMASLPDLEATVRDNPRLRLVILDACHTLRLAAALALHVPAVLGMRGMIQIKTCEVFILGFYRALLSGEPYEAALTAARQEVDKQLPGSREWGLMALYLQTPEGDVAVRHAVPSPRPVSRRAAAAPRPSAMGAMVADKLVTDAPASPDVLEKFLQFELAAGAAADPARRVAGLWAVILRQNLQELERRQRVDAPVPEFLRRQIEAARRQLDGLEPDLR